MRKTLVVAITALLSFATAAGAAASSPTGPTDDYYIAVLADLDPGATPTAEQLQKIDAETKTSSHDTTQSGLTRITSLTAGTPTPDGFSLWNPGTRTTDYVYNSDKRAVNLKHCTPTCTTIDTWNVSIKENAFGGTSTRWNITMNAARAKGTTPTTFSYEYYCGVDINNASDVLCAGGGADHSASGALNPGDSINKSFGASSSNRVFPMIRISALFAVPGGQVVVSAPFRGWDVCNNNAGNIKLCVAAKY